jgi:acyl-CoA synthetase (AMP-forming)/AMP-acid ligase II
MRERRPTFLSMLPAALLSLIREEGTTADDFSSLRLARSGGDKVPSELEKEFHALTGHFVSEGYGLTETGLAARNPPSGLDKLGSIGQPSPGFAFSIRGADEKEVAAGEEGRVWIKTRTEMAGYWNDPQATAVVNRDGWFDTSDVMKVDEDGYLWFCGRQKQIIVHDGSNISPQELRTRCSSIPPWRMPGWSASECPARRECPRLCGAEAGCCAAVGRRADPVRPRARRLQGAGGDRLSRYAAAQRHRQGRPRQAEGARRRRPRTHGLILASPNRLSPPFRRTKRMD